jgi:hypothetical protein
VKESDDPLSDPVVISQAIKKGILDTPHFQGNPHLCGKIITRLINGAWYAIDPSSGEKLSEQQRISQIN